MALATLAVTPAHALQSQGQISETILATGQLLPVVFGERVVHGMVFAAHYASPRWTMGVAWALGPQSGIDSILLDGAAPTASTETRSYIGTPDQSPDATLSALIAGYKDKLILSASLGIAYSVISWLETDYEAIPQFTARVSGIDGVTNAALAAREVITNPLWGLNEPVDEAAFADASEYLEELLGDGFQRRGLALVLEQRQSALRWIEILAGYAAGWIWKENRSWRIALDRPGESTARIDLDNTIAGSLRIDTLTESDRPNIVQVEWLDTSDGTGSIRTAEARLSEFAAPRISRVSLPGIPTWSQAVREANERLAKLNGQLRRVAVRGLHDLLLYTLGSLVEVEVSAGITMLARVVSPPAVSSQNVWSLELLEYDGSVYSDQVSTERSPELGQVVYGA